ncbi:MAG TPA: restriction endonuclease [Candidatus Obscuribacter sp.]|nr:restriction endonuclease [Candidatus Obscuribacter sp.]
MAKKRESIPAEVLQQVLLNSKRRCCICHEKGKKGVREGSVAQLAVGTNSPTIETEDNLVFLCHTHHKMLDSESLSVDHIRKARAYLYRALEQPPSAKESDSAWEKYEKHIYSLFSAELEKSMPDLVTVHYNRPYPGRSGCVREVDVSATINVGGLRVLIALNVKMTNQLITPADVESFSGLIQDIGANKGLFVSSNGYSQAAKRVAQTLGIALATVKADSSDFKSGILLDPLINSESNMNL